MHSDIEFEFDKPDLTIHIEDSQGNTIPMQVLLRPNVKTFLQQVSQKYEVVVFTAGEEYYAKQILDYLDPCN